MQILFAFCIIMMVYINYKLVPLLIIPFIFISYFRLIKYKNLADVIILILMSRCIMGFLIPHSDMGFNLLNALCCYVPFFIYILNRPLTFYSPNYSLILRYKWTIVYAFCLIILSLYDFNIAKTEFRLEVLPILLIVFLICFSNINLDIDHVLLFLRFAFIASILTYFLPNYFETCDKLVREAIVFKEPAILPLRVGNIFVKQMGFIFDWRTMGQIGFIYLLLILVSKSKEIRMFDHILIIILVISTFSRGPIVVMGLIYFGLFITKLRIELLRKYLSLLILISLILSFAGYIVYQNKTKQLEKYISSYFSQSKNSALSQRKGFTNYAIEKAKNHYMTGLGIGALSSKNATNKIYFGYANKQKTKKIYYYQVGDAYWALSLGEKGIIGLVIFILSTFELFYRKNSIIFLFFLIGFYINLIGTDIPKEGMYYFVILLLMLNMKYPDNLSVGKAPLIE